MRGSPGSRWRGRLRCAGPCPSSPAASRAASLPIPCPSPAAAPPHRETQRDKDTETQKHGNTQRDRETKKHRDTETQRHRDTETDIERERERERESQRGTPNESASDAAHARGVRRRGRGEEGRESTWTQETEKVVSTPEMEPLTRPRERLFISSSSTSSSCPPTRRRGSAAPSSRAFKLCCAHCTRERERARARESARQRERARARESQREAPSVAALLSTRIPISHLPLSPRVWSTRGGGLGRREGGGTGRLVRAAMEEKRTVRESAGMSRRCSMSAKMRIFSRSAC
eukprot:344297-Rhodomonas_salina.3